ncbi:MAG: hypothetical protein MUE95_12845 [Cyclobacteriaceae bacterium]|nr:hypothetical protein [Cyclobacteriaceae bacterium]
MKQLILESSAAWIVVCVIAGMSYALLLYRSKHPWSNALNRILFVLRAVVVFLLTFFLLGPIVKQVQNEFEKPVFVLLQDNSLSIKESTSEEVQQSLIRQLQETEKRLEEKGYEVFRQSFSEDEFDEAFTGQSSDVHDVLRGISNRYEGRNIGGVLLATDGIYTSGLSPLYGNYPFPVYSVGVGDTTVRADLLIRNLVYNKIAYEGNKFPLRVEVASKGFFGQNINISLIHQDKVVEKLSRTVADDGFIPVEFLPLAAAQGIQRWDVEVEAKPEEHNTRNNRASVFIEVVEGKKKILLVAAAPHPDIKAIRSVVELNANAEFHLHIPGVAEAEPKYLQPENIDLVIFHQVPDVRGRLREVFQRLARSKASVLLVIGQQTDLNQVAQQQLPLSFEQMPRQYDEVTPVISSIFSNFTISSEALSTFSTFPPVQVHFGKAQIPAVANTILMQRVGNLITDKPLLYVVQDEQRKTGVLLGEGIWRWRLHEYSRSERTSGFDEVFGKLFQYLTSEEDKRKFRSYPVQQQFTDTEPVIFESQVYNDIYEPVYGNTIDLEVTSEKGQKQRFSYTLSPGNTRYPIGGLEEGVYRYTSSTIISNQRESVSGQFLVVPQQLELQNLTADFDLLRKLSRQTGGSFYTTAQWESLDNDLMRSEATQVIRSVERYDSLISLRWIFFLLLLLVGAEWFLRKYYGGY